MIDPLIYLTYLAVILLVGIICSLVSKKLRIQNILLLLIAGIILNNIYYKGEHIISFPPVFLTSIAILALVMIIFDSTSRFNIKEFDTFSIRALKVSLVFLVMNLLLLTIAVKLIFAVPSIFLCLLFAALMSGTDPDAVMLTLGKARNRVVEFLEIESILNTPLTVLLPFIFLDFMTQLNTQILSKFIEEIIPFLQQIITGIGAGVLIGLIVFKGMRKSYSDTLSPLALITAALISYILAENLGGNGILAVTAMGLFFGNIYVKEKAQLQEFSTMFTSALEILVFVLLGLTVNIPWNLGFIMISSVLFIIYLVIRYLSIELAMGGEFNLKEKIFMTLNVQKGIAVAVIAFTLVSYTITQSVRGAEPYQVLLTSIPGVQTVLNLTLIFMLYSIILSTIASKFSGYFIRAEGKRR